MVSRAALNPAREKESLACPRPPFGSGPRATASRPLRNAESAARLSRAKALLPDVKKPMFAPPTDICTGFPPSALRG
jgi:hypothetical protein